MSFNIILLIENIDNSSPSFNFDIKKEQSIEISSSYKKHKKPQEKILLLL